MATVAGVKIKTKVKATRSAYLADEKYTGSEPVWDTERAERFDDAVFDHHLRRSMNYYNYHFSQKDLKKYVVEWMKNSETYDKDEIRAFERTGDRSIPMTVCSLIKAHKQGMPLLERHLTFITKEIADAISSAEPEPDEVKVEVAKPYVPTIQDRLNEKTAETIGELEGHFDEVWNNPKYNFKPYDFFVANNVPQSQLTKYEELYQARFNELKAAFEKEDAQLVEGYKHLKAVDFKRMFTFMDALLNDIMSYRNVKKATKKVRAPRAVSKEKVVSKLKYAKEDKPLKIISINPADIIGSNELWVYNVKTRKLGKYIADSLQGPLNVKGTTITGFDEHKSVSKTLRKPEEKLKEFAKAGKIQLRKFMDEIKATETVLNGRISTDVVLLRVQ
jgi:hypothetical protein